MKRLLSLICPTHRSTSPERNSGTSLASAVLAFCPTLLLATGIAGAQTPQTPGISLAVTSSAGAVTSVPAGTTITLTAAVPSGNGFLQTGIIRFCDSAVAPHCTNENKLANAQLTRSGSASYKFTPGPGAHAFTAVFLQQWRYNTVSSAPAALNVTTVGSSTTALSSTGTVGAYTLSAKIATAGLAGVAPTGSVQFLDSSANNFVLGTSPLVSGAGAGGGLSFLANNLTTGTVSGSSSVTVADFNGDGKLDLAVVGANSTSVTMLLGAGDGTFTKGASFGNFYQGVYQIKHADFNQDGKEDLALVDLNNSVIHIFLGKGDGTFTQAADAVSMNGANSVTITDFNNDGIPDLIVANRYSDTVSFLAGKGDGTFTSGWDSYVSWQNPSYVLAADFNGDGKQDFAVNILNGAGIAIYLGKGDGTFAAPVYYTVGNGPAFMAAGDFTGDGKVDIAVANSVDNTITLLIGKGDGTFTARAPFPAPAGLTDIAAADFNGDGKLDLVVSTSTTGNGLAYFMGNGDGTFSVPTIVATAAGPYGLALGDFNNDGTADVASANTGSSATAVLTRLARSSSATLTALSIPGTGTHNVVARYLGDTNFNSSTSTPLPLLAQTTPTQLFLWTSTWFSNFGQQVVLTANLSPYSVAPATSNGESVTFYSDGQVIGTAKLNSGSATLNVTSLPVGFHTLTASYSGDAQLNASQGFNFISVNPASNSWNWWF